MGKTPAFVFDLDDTLYLERDYTRSALQYAGRAVTAGFGVANAAELLWQLFIEGAADPIGTVWRKFDLPEPERAAIIRAMQAHRPEIHLYEGAKLLLSTLRAGKHDFVILTDGRSITQRQKIASLGCDDAAMISISSECGLAKTDPARLVPIAARFADYDLVMIGDNPAKDFVIANSLGWQTVMLRDKGLNIHPQIADLQPGYAAQIVIDDLAELIGMILDPD